MIYNYATSSYRKIEDLEKDFNGCYEIDKEDYPTKEAYFLDTDLELEFCKNLSLFYGNLTNGKDWGDWIEYILTGIGQTGIKLNFSRKSVGIEYPPNTYINQLTSKYLERESKKIEKKFTRLKDLLKYLRSRGIELTYNEFTTNLLKNEN